MFSKFLNDPLDEHYLIPLPDSYVEGELPVEEVSVRHSLLEYRARYDALQSCGLLAIIFKTEEYRSTKSMLEKSHSRLLELVNSSPLHKAAIRRIVNDMPSGNGGREALREFIR